MIHDVHVIWMQGWEWAPQRIEERVQKNRATWSQLGLRMQMWDEKKIVNIIQDIQLKAWFLSLQTTIAKCDVGRAIILQRFGGIYADADFDPDPKGIKLLIEECQHLKTRVLFPKDPAMGLVNNYLIVSPPNASFWKLYFHGAQESIHSPRWQDVVYALLRPTWPVLSSHGPVLISRLIHTFADLKTAAPSNVSPVMLGLHGWLEGEQDSAWYRTKPERLQRHVALTVLVFAILGVVSFLALIVKQIQG